MLSKLPRLFVYSAGTLLLFTAAAKLVSSGGDARILQMTDPIVGIRFRNLLWLVGGVELVVAVVCLSRRRLGLQAALVGWFAVNCVVYRLSLLLVGYHRPCPCLGTLTDSLGVSPNVVDNFLKTVLAYLLLGSCITLLYVWREGRPGGQTPTVHPDPI
jgi:hypothetical protein